MQISGPGPQPQSVADPAVRTVVAQVVAGQLARLPIGSTLPASVVRVSPQGMLLEANGVRIQVPPQSLAGGGGALGAEVALRLVATQPRLLVQIGPASSAVAAAAAESPVEPPPLQPGQIVVARVVGDAGQATLQLELDGQTLEAARPPGLPIRQELHLEVEQTSPQLTFRVLDDDELLTAAAGKLLRTAAGDSQPANRTLQALVLTLARSLADLPVGAAPESLTALGDLLGRLLPDGPASAETILRYLQDGGQDYESKLARLVAQNRSDAGPAAEQLARHDLKGALLRLLGDLRTTNLSAPLADLLGPLQDHLKNLEAQQLANVVAHAADAPYQWQIPLFEPPSHVTAYLSVGDDDEQTESMLRGEKAPHHLFLSLELERLGAVRIDAHVGAKNMWAIFYADQADTLATLRQSLPELQRALRELGFRESQLVAKPMGLMRPEQQAKFAALGQPGGASVRLVDLRG